VDLHAWGESVVTTGFGDLFHANGINAYYTGRFGGTSSAAAITAGAAADLQSIAIANGGRQPLSSMDLRRFLVESGGDSVGSPPIGTSPNLKSAIERYFGSICSSTQHE
jgi:hypothetical protein